MARSLNIDKFIINVDAFEGFINVDASEVINLFSNLNASNWLTQPIVDDCRNIFRAFQEFKSSTCSTATGKPTKLLMLLQNFAAANLHLLFIM